MYSVILHEIAHGYTAAYFGDNTARDSGRLSFNPIRHIDLFGTVILPLMLKLSKSPVIFGWAKPVPVNYYNLVKPVRSMMLVALAGPATNVVLAIVFAFIANFFSLFYMITPNSMPYIIYSVSIITAYINLFLAFFNMLPFPPMDGSRVLRYFLSDNIRQYYDRLEKYGMLIIFIFLFFGKGVFSYIGDFVYILLDILIIS